MSFKLINGVIGNLNEDEIMLIIELISPEIIVKIVKNNLKTFKEETKGCTINVKSNLLILRIKAFLKREISNKRTFAINILNDYANHEIIKIKKTITQRADDNFLENAVKNNNIDDFKKLIEILLEFLQPQWIKIFFKLANLNLTDQQDEFLKNEVHNIINSKELRANLEKEFYNEFKKKISETEIKFEAKITDLIANNKNLKDNLDEKIQELLTEKINVENLEKNIINIEKENIKKILSYNNEISRLKENIEKLNCVNTEIADELIRKNIEIEDLKNNLHIRYEEYSIEAYAKWQLENNSLINTQKDYENICADLVEKEKILNENINIQIMKKSELEEKISTYNNMVSEFVNNIDKKIIEKALFDSIVRVDLPKSNKTIESKETSISTEILGKLAIGNSRPYIKLNKKLISNVSCDTINDLAENIAINLESIGVKKIADEVANYIVGILSAGMTPLICGGKTREVAVAICSAYCTETPIIVTLPNGYSNANELYEIYCSTQAKSVLIEDAIGTMNENSILPLLRERQEMGFAKKILLLSTENEHSIKFMPKNLLNYIAIVNIDKFGISSHNPFVVSNAENILEQFSKINNSDYDYDYKKVKKLLSHVELSSLYILLRGYIISYSHKISNIKQAVYGYARMEIRLLCNNYDFYTQIEKNVNTYVNDFDNNLLDIIKGDADE